jgi:hypothetical protein
MCACACVLVRACNQECRLRTDTCALHRRSCLPSSAWRSTEARSRSTWRSCRLRGCGSSCSRTQVRLLCTRDRIPFQFVTLDEQASTGPREGVCQHTRTKPPRRHLCGAAAARADTAAHVCARAARQAQGHGAPGHGAPQGGAARGAGGGGGRGGGSGGTGAQRWRRQQRRRGGAAVVLVRNAHLMASATPPRDIKHTPRGGTL